MDTNTDTVLDVRTLIPMKRHEKLNKMFNELPKGESFTFINDHDPKPLYYEFQSIHGKVVGWEYLNKGGKEWKVKVTRLANSVSQDMQDVSTLIDLRATEEKDWKHTVFHRYGMMAEGDVMKLISEGYPNNIKKIFEDKFAGLFEWKFKKQEPDEVVAHITKIREKGEEKTKERNIGEYDLRGLAPADRHELVFSNFDTIRSGESFIFINDHDPKPLYYQIEAESTIPFQWEYLISGPTEWKIKVSKS